MDFDLVIKNGTVIDGTGRPRFRADVGIRKGRIAAVVAGGPLNGAEVLDATGLVVAPGFIDVHTHFDWNLPLADHDQTLAPIVLQGVTTVVTGNCGSSAAPVNEASIPLLAYRLSAYGASSETEETEGRQPYFRWRSVAEYLDILESGGVLLNTAFLVGHGSLRYAVMGERANGGSPTPEEVGAMRQHARQALREGAFGLSAGLAYEPGMYADAEELLPLLETTAEEGGFYAVHSRSYSCISPFYPPDLDTPSNVLATREQLELAQRAGVRLQLSHLIFHGRRTWPTYRTVLNDVEQAAAQGLEVAFDAFPYTFGNTTIHVNFPKWFLRDLFNNINDSEALCRLEKEMAHRHRLIGRDYSDIILMHGAAPELAELEGLDFAAIAQRLGTSEFEAYMHVARVGGSAARILQDTYSGDSESEEPLRAILKHPRCAFMTDTLIFREGYPNRATYGAFPRLLGHYSRDLSLFPLEEAVHRMTGFSAERLGLEKEIGRVAEGYWADLVLFDPETVADKSTREHPDAAPVGIRAVLLTGQVTTRDGKIVGKQRRGRVLRR
ncbi:MAG: N-acyl-D-amino-acid deacylase family protein [Anaerolineae bacterium]